jgi:AAA+ ATPase superfamily predicted ATPase
MAAFVGRDRELGRLHDALQRVVQTRQGVLLTVRGRRQVGKSRLLEEFLRRADARSVFFAATQGADPDRERAAFARSVAASDLEAAAVFGDLSFASWEALLRLLGEQTQTASVIVLDELPWLLDRDRELEGVLQHVWDRHLSAAPVLVVALGSDLAMMELLGGYGRPLYGRLREMVLDPLSVGDTGYMLGLDAPSAFDAQLVTGGFPRLAQEWGDAPSAMAFVRRQLADATAPLVVLGERAMHAEFPATLQARDVLRAIGAGGTTYNDIANRAGVSGGSLGRVLTTLIDDKRVVSASRPLSATPFKSTRYHVADPYLRFWLRFVEPHTELILRGRGDVAADRIERSWPDYRGVAVEPLIRASLERLMPDPRLPEALHVGGYWTRTGDVEVDLVGGARPAAPTDVVFLGSIKWRERRPFRREDLRALAEQRAHVPGAHDAHLVGVSRTGFTTTELDAAFGADDLLAAWRP